MSAHPIAWTIAGTDPSGGAGIQADLKTFHSLDVYGCSVITAVVSQTAQQVAHIDYPSEQSIASQLSVLKEEFPPRAVKTGMLAKASTVELVAEALTGMDTFVVCDPVLRSSTGTILLEETAESILRAKLLPCVNLLTPNLPEAAHLTGIPVNDSDDLAEAAQRLLAMGVQSVLLKGGHRDHDFSQDYWTDGQKTLWFTHRRVSNPVTHGSGCTLSSAVAAEIAKGSGIVDAIAQAKAYVYRGIRIGSGYGSLAHEHGRAGEVDMPMVTETAEEGVKAVMR